MPFQVSPTNAERPEPVLRIVGNTIFHVESGFAFCHGGSCVEVPPDGPDETTDLATVPPWLWGLLASYGRQTLPALLHDSLCDAAAADPDPGKRYELRRKADDLFRTALLDEGVSSFRAATFWAGVVLGRFLTYRRALAALLIGTVLVSTAAFYAGIGFAIAGSGDARWLGMTCAAPLLLAAPWFRDRVHAVVLVGTWVGLPVLVLLIVDVVVQVWTSVIPWLVQWLLSPLPGISKPSGTPTIRPTRARPLR